MFLKNIKNPVFTTLSAAALALIFVASVPTQAAASTKEVRVSLQKYCKSRKLTYGGYSKKRKAFTCGVLATGFNTYYMTKLRNINLSTVCKKYHGTDRWRFHGEKVWCIVPVGSNLTLCNRRNEEIWTVTAHYVKPKRRGRERGWVTEGWWKINPGQCRKLWNNTSYTGDIYLHATTRRGDLPGRDARLCVHKGSAFKISDSDKNCSGQNRKKVGMSKFVVRSGNNTWNFR